MKPGAFLTIPLLLANQAAFAGSADGSGALALAAGRAALPSSFLRCYGTEMTSRAMLEWTQPNRRRVALHRAGQARAERLRCELQRPLRDESLNEEVFTKLAEARAVIERWRLDCNYARPLALKRMRNWGTSLLKHTHFKDMFS